MKRVIVIGRNHMEARVHRSRLIEQSPELQADTRQIEAISVDSVRHGRLRGLRPDLAELVIHERAWRHPWALPLYSEIRHLEALGVETTPMFDEVRA